MNVPFADLKMLHAPINSELNDAIQEVIETVSFIGTPNNTFVQKFESEFAAFLGIKHCIACANGTDALELALRAIDLRADEEVIVPARTWIATSEAVTYAGGKVVFVDVDENGLLDWRLLEQLITSKTRAIIPVHLYGLPCEMDEILDIAHKHHLIVIEDSAQAHGATYKGKCVGTLGDFGTFSFFPGKNLGGFGDAGGIVCHSDEYAQKVKKLANHGRLGKFDHELEGRNSRMDGIQAGILSVKLPFLANWNIERRAAAEKYRECLVGTSLNLPNDTIDAMHVYHLFVVEIEARDDVRQQLKEVGIDTGIHYPMALPFLSAYKYLNHSHQDFPSAYRQMSRVLSLPIFPGITDNQIEYVTESLIKSLNLTQRARRGNISVPS